MLISDVPAVSVMLCTNRVDEYFNLALASIENQNFIDIEIIIVANGLSDQEFEILTRRASDPRVRVFRTDISGVTFSRNLALHHCRAPLIAVMDADDISYPQRLSKQVEFLLCNPEIAVCGSGYDVIDESDKIITLHLLPETDVEIKRALRWKNPLCHPSVIFRRDAILNVGGYLGNSAEDYELWIRLLEDESIRFANIRHSLLGYRVPVISVARRSRRAYIHVAGAQYRTFLRTKNPLWLLASLCTAAKVWFRASRL